MTDQQNNTVLDGVRAFYEHTRGLFAQQMPEAHLPAFDDLSGDQVRAWLLAYAATAEVSVRMSDALKAMDLTP